MNGKELNEIRKQKKLSFKELSELSNIPKSTIEKVLLEITPHPRIDTVQAIEKALGVSPEPQSTEITEERLHCSIYVSVLYIIGIVADFFIRKVQIIGITAIIHVYVAIIYALQSTIII